MKTQKTLLTFLFLMLSSLVSAQKTIYSTWSFNNTDSTAALYPGKTVLFNTIDEKNGICYTLSFEFTGWILQKLDTKNNTILWKNSRNANVPIDSKGLDHYIPRNLAINQQGNIEVYAVDLDAIKPIVASSNGLAIKVVYDKNTGKEIAYYGPKKENGGLRVVGGAGTPVFPHEKGYCMLERSPKANASMVMLKLDSAYTLVDTIGYLKKGLNPQEPQLRNLESKFHKVKDNFYALSYFWNGDYDTTFYRHVFSKINSKTWKIEEKEISKDVFYGIFNYQYNGISDGFLLSGVVDTALGIIKKVKEKDEAFVFKIDTNGVVKWKVLIPHPTVGFYYNRIAASEDTVRKGYWVIAGNETKDVTPIGLFFISNEGKMSKIGDIWEDNLKKNAYSPFLINVLNNGNMLLSLREWKCNESGYPYCYKTMVINPGNITFTNDISAIGAPKILVYPNPANNYINVSISTETQKEVQITLFNALGIEKQKYKGLSNDANTIDVSTLSNGIYFLNVVIDKKNYTQKVIIEH